MAPEKTSELQSQTQFWLSGFQTSISRIVSVSKNKYGIDVYEICSLIPWILIV